MCSCFHNLVFIPHSFCYVSALLLLTWHSNHHSDLYVFSLPLLSLLVLLSSLLSSLFSHFPVSLGCWCSYNHSGIILSLSPSSRTDSYDFEPKPVGKKQILLYVLSAPTYWVNWLALFQ